jgi:hypothetical protein
MQNEVSSGEHRGDIHGAQGERRPGLDGKFSTTVNETKVKFSDPTPSGSRILDKAGLRPVSEHVLIQLMHHSSRSIGLDETVDLRVAGTEIFRAFKSDRVFRFTLNEHGFEWGVGKLPEPELREIARVPEDEVLVLEREGNDIGLKPTDVLDLTGTGTEHLRTEKRLVTVYFDNEPREIPWGVYTTEQLKQLLGVQDGYVLEFISHEGQLTPLKPEAKLQVKQGMRFFEQVPCGGSS